jgi:hypothetical protein
LIQIGSRFRKTIPGAGRWGLGVTEVGVRVGVAMPQKPIDTRHTPYGVGEVGVLQQTCKTHLAPSVSRQRRRGTVKANYNLFNPHLPHPLGEIPTYKRSLWGGSHPPNYHPTATPSNTDERGGRAR